MPKTRDQKAQILENLQNKLAQKKAVVLMNYKGLKVEESEELRRKLRDNKIDYLISKNSLLKIVLDKQGIKIEPQVLNQPLALAFSYDDEVVICKEITLFAKEHEALEILGAVLDEGFVSQTTVEALAKLPSKEELLAKMVGSLNAPLSGMVNVLVGNFRDLVTVLNQIKEQKQ